MLYEIGSFLFRLGIAVTIMYFVAYTLAASFGIPVPQELASGNAFTEMLTGRVGGFLTAASLGVGALIGVKAIEVFTRSIFGASFELEMGKLNAIFAFISLFTVAQAGIATAVKLFSEYVAWALPPLAGGVAAFSIIANALSAVGLSYFLMVKLFGAPTF